jgi:hypothetical protein
MMAIVACDSHTCDRLEGSVFLRRSERWARRLLHHRWFRRRWSGELSSWLAREDGSLDFVSFVSPKLARTLDQTSVSPVNSWKNWVRTQDFGSIRAVSAWSSLASPRAHTCRGAPILGRRGKRGDKILTCS